MAILISRHRSRIEENGSLENPHGFQCFLVSTLNVHRSGEVKKQRSHENESITKYSRRMCIRIGISNQRIRYRIIGKKIYMS